MAFLGLDAHGHDFERAQRHPQDLDGYPMTTYPRDHDVGREFAIIAPVFVFGKGVQNTRVHRDEYQTINFFLRE
jgi:hypothetical protein